MPDSSALSFVLNRLTTDPPEPAPQAATGSLSDRSDSAVPVTGAPQTGLDRPPDPGPTIPGPDQLASVLRAAGHRILTADGRLFTSNASQLTPALREAIKTHKTALIALAEPWTVDSTVIRTPSSAPMSLAQFLGTELPRVDPSWIPDEPPSLSGIDEIVVNVATSSLDWYHGSKMAGITVSTLDGVLTRFLPFKFRGGGNLDEDTIKRWAERELRDKKIYGSNIKFDLHHTFVWGVDLEAQGCRFSDIQHSAALDDDQRRQFRIDKLAEHYLPDLPMTQRVDETKHAEYHAAEVAKREYFTAQLVGKLKTVIYPRLVEQDLMRVQQLEDDVIPPTVDMEKNALLTDRQLLRQWAVEVERIQHECLREVSNEVGFMVNPDSPDDWQKLFGHFGIPFGGTTDKGKPSFTDKILKGIDNRFIQLVRRAGKLASLNSKFFKAYDAVIGEDCLLRYSLHQLRVDDHGTVRGRFSASDKNIQQLMNRDTHMESFGSEEFFVRRLIIAPPGRLFASFDAEQIEFRIFGHHAESERIYAEYRKNPEVSFHRIVEQMVKPFRSDLPYTKIKSLNFLCIYGGGKTHAAEFLELPQDVTDQFWEVYHRAFPEVKTVLRKAENAAKTRGYVKSILGRRARFPDPKFAYKAWNAVAQPTAADIFKTKIVEVYRERKRTGFVLRAPVHDELVGDVPDQESARMVLEILNRQSFPKLRVPILWAGGTGSSWAEAK